MPAVNPGANNDYYCDANSVGGNTCWEQDIIESTDATVSTSHPSGNGGGIPYFYNYSLVLMYHVPFVFDFDECSDNCVPCCHLLNNSNSIQ